MTNLRIRTCESNSAAEWDEYVKSNCKATHYHLYEWRNFFRNQGKETLYLAAYVGNSIVGISPLVRQKSLFFGDFLVSLPFFNYGGILADDENVASLLFSESCEAAEKLGVTHIEFREFERRPDVPFRSEKVSMRLALPSSIDELGKTLKAKLRSQIRRPTRENPDIFVGSEELVDRFYEVFSRNMRDLGTPVYAKTMFKDILRRFPDDTSIVLIEIKGQPVAAAFLLHHNDLTEVPWASTDRRFNKISINMLLYWEMFRVSILRGSKFFDFGRSTIDSGTYRFKKQWGAVPTQLYWNYWLRAGEEVPKINPENSKYSLAISLWKRLPLFVSKLIGPYVVRHLP